MLLASSAENPRLYLILKGFPCSLPAVSEFRDLHEVSDVFWTVLCVAWAANSSAAPGHAESWFPGTSHFHSHLAIFLFPFLLCNIISVVFS